MNANPNETATKPATVAANDESVPVARLYRMKMEKHVCPYGLKAKHLLEKRGFRIEDHPLTSKEQTEAFKAEHGVGTTPQVFIGTERVGGYESLREHFGLKVKSKDETTYAPIIALFGMAFLMAMAVSTISAAAPLSDRTLPLFVAISMCLLALQKLQDVERFATMFLSYDLLAKRWVPYGTWYPFLEGGAGVLMLAGVLTWLAAPVALVIGSIGAWSVFKAVYLEKRELKCACVGGASNVPLGFVSLTENVGMVLMALWMLGTLF